MSVLTDAEALALARPGETPWEGWEASEVILQRECTDCDHGLLLYPARFCPRCGGDGFLRRIVQRASPC